jgi:regulator of protease activity HflC (stomatin/prohibitin superfamily)
MPGQLVAALLVGAILAIVLLGLAIGLKRVGPTERLVVFRLGRADPSAVRGPGWVMLAPIVDRAVRVSLAERVTAIPAVDLPTADGATVRVGLTLRWRIDDPYRSVTAVYDLEAALPEVAVQRLAKIVVASPALAIDARGGMASALEAAMAAVAGAWGVSIEGVEVSFVG